MRGPSDSPEPVQSGERHAQDRGRVEGVSDDLGERPREDHGSEERIAVGLDISADPLSRGLYSPRERPRRRPRRSRPC